MSLSVNFHRSASAEFIEASAWYETKRVGLALDFLAEKHRIVVLAVFHGSRDPAIWQARA